MASSFVAPFLCMHIGHESKQELTGVGEQRRLTRRVGVRKRRVEICRDVLNIHNTLVLKCDTAPCTLKTHSENETDKYTKPQQRLVRSTRRVAAGACWQM